MLKSVTAVLAFLDHPGNHKEIFIPCFSPSSGVCQSVLAFLVCKCLTDVSALIILPVLI